MRLSKYGLDRHVLQEGSFRAWAPFKVDSFFWFWEKLWQGQLVSISSELQNGTCCNIRLQEWTTPCKNNLSEKGTCWSRYASMLKQLFLRRCDASNQHWRIPIPTSYFRSGLAASCVGHVVNSFSCIHPSVLPSPLESFPLMFHGPSSMIRCARHELGKSNPLHDFPARSGDKRDRPRTTTCTFVPFFTLQGPAL